MKENIIISLGDITMLNPKDVDIIVNAANRKLMGGSGVDGAIHRAAGFKLHLECLTLGGCEYGEAKLTKAYNLPYKGIIHTVAPIYHSEEWANAHNYNQVDMLSNCYKNSLQLALDNNFTKIAFPALGCGVYGWNYEEAFKIALNTVIEFLKEHNEMKVQFIFFEKDGFEICNKIFNNFYS